MKLISFIRASETSDRLAFQDWAIREFAPSVAQRCPNLSFLAIDVVNPPSEKRPLRSPTDPTANDGPGSRPPYDVVYEAKAETAEDWRRILLTLGNKDLLVRTEFIHAYRVSDRVIWDDQGVRGGEVTPGVKLIGRLMFHADMPDSAVKRSWGLHGKLARKVHVGCSKYIQNWVEETLIPGSPETRGMPQLNFPSEKDFTERFFDSPRGQEEILQDVSHFVQGGPRMETTEHVFLSAPAKD
jgi:hypothetical protein